MELKTCSVISADGTVIGYRILGSGPGLILVHGGMGASQNFRSMAEALSDAFTVYIPDRRGRGLSGPFGDSYGIRKEVEDLDALITQTGAHYVFGLSSGALISLQAALALPAIRKAALYEPPLSDDHSLEASVTPFMQRYDREVARGDLAAAFVTIMKGLELVPPVLSVMPRFLLVRFFRLAIREDERSLKGDDVPLRALIPTQHYDYQLVLETEGTLENFKAVRAEVLLLGGSKSPRFLKHALDALSKILPNARRIEFPGLGHTAPVDGGKNSERVVQELRRFFL
jgi:pimeloyl-ACP methyl ester carboxylesterase